ncbi:MAG: IS4 family transposase [Polyangiaceae bacterium]
MELNSKTIGEELGRARFGDRRLARRLQCLTERLSGNPSLSFPKALASGAELEGAYRFFGNPLVSPELILSGHFDATRGRCVEEEAVLVVHDSTTVSFREDGQRRGLGRLRTTNQTFFAHVALVISDDSTRRPLGVAGMSTWVRGEDKASERERWGQMVETAEANLLGATIIHVMDREADDYPLFSQLVEAKQRFVIRSMHNRLLTDQLEGFEKLDEALTTVETMVEREAPISRRKTAHAPKKRAIHPPRTARTARLAIGATTVSLRRPRPHPRDTEEKRKKSLPASITLNVVRVWEPQPPDGERAIEWVLLTTEPIESIEDVLRTVDRYRARWTIEEYFKALKTGCAYEERQLGDYESLINALAVFAPIACTLLALRSEARRDPDAPAERVLTAVQIEVLQALGRLPLPPNPSVRQVLLAVAALGGHVKYSGNPGWLTLGRGHAELLVLTRGWEAAKLQLARDQR